MGVKSRNVVASVMLVLGVNVVDALAQTPSTADFMNALTVCGLGSSIKIDANLKGSLKSLYEGETTQGKAIQEIIPMIAEKFPEGENYNLYVGCLGRMLSK